MPANLTPRTFESNEQAGGWPVPTVAASQQGSRLHRTPTVRQAVAPHIKAVHDCDASSLVDGYSANAKVFFPDGAVVKGRKELQGVYDKLRQAA
jgi:hypothetical protein